jgi:uncharacterized protein (TIGR02246 family)
MARLTAPLVAAILGLCGVCAYAAESRGDDEMSIRQLQAGQEASWNRHDAESYAKLFTADGDVVNVMGWWWRGRAQIQHNLGLAFSSVFHDSKLTVTETHVRFLSDDIAIAHVKWTMSGAKTPAGLPVPREGIQLQVLRRQAGHWLIDSFQNTNSMPERPFPSTPPAGAKSP